MYLKRNNVIRGLPIPRKGTKYIAKASSHSNSGVPVVVAIRDMLGFAKNSKEVKHMVNAEAIKINGKIVKDIKESIRLFNVLEAGKNYELKVLPTGRFFFEDVKGNERNCKVINKKILPKKKIQFNLHDGTNVLSNDKIKIGDTIVLGFDGKIKKVIEMTEGKKVFVTSGKSVGLEGKIKKVTGGKALVDFKEFGKEVELHKSHLIAL